MTRARFAVETFMSMGEQKAATGNADVAALLRSAVQLLALAADKLDGRT